MLLLSQSLQKVQLEEITVLWGIYMSPDTFNLLEIGMILCGTVDQTVCDILVTRQYMGVVRMVLSKFSVKTWSENLFGTDSDH